MVQQMFDALATTASRIEIIFHPSAVYLPNFPRLIQTNRQSCGKKATWVCLEYFGKRCTHRKHQQMLGTDSEGTNKTSIKRTLRSFGLVVREVDHNTLCSGTERMTEEPQLRAASTSISFARAEL